MVTWPALDQTYPLDLHCDSTLEDLCGHAGSEVWNEHRRDVSKNGNGQAEREAESWSMEKQP